MFYRFTVRYYDEDSNPNIVKESGVVIGESYSCAIRNVKDYYGDENIISIFLSFINEDKILHVSNNMLNTIVKDNEEVWEYQNIVNVEL